MSSRHSTSCHRQALPSSAWVFLIPIVYLMWLLRYGRVAGDNPLGAVGLEWTTTSPPPTSNFAQTPVVTWGEQPSGRISRSLTVRAARVRDARRAPYL